MSKPRQMILNAFDMNCAGHINHGLWSHPRDRSAEFGSLDYWVNLARVAERGLFDAIFIADIAGVYDVYKGSPAPSLLTGAQVPVNDPLLVVPTMAYATQNIGFGVTVSTSYEHPYILARRLSTLDHLTGGRVGWNIVTGYVDSAARGVGRDAQIDHDTRYDIADEFLDVAYKLWETSWDDDALLVDRERRIFADPDKVRPVRHQGEHYRVDAIHMCAPSPQRTPVLFQAGSSTRGRRFAARHAECVFTFGPTPAANRSVVREIREEAVRAGRDPYDIRVIVSQSLVVGRTRKEAEEKLADYRAHASIEGALAHFSSSTGIDFAKFDLDEPIPYVKNDANNSAVEAITTRSAQVWTVRKIIDSIVLGSRVPPFVGSAEEVADHLESWVDDADVDGFNLPRTVTPECLEDFVDLVVPILQERGRFKREYAPGPLRQKLFGHPRLAAPHYGARLRDAARVADGAAARSVA
ncbi:LLM class flavin-dependent oxidoreductase [Methylobrevis albus]|uniref:LLM class flavin-dependent oxidoreductase n=1 Tax=Methylobrevis albus TaxID=2793297 RepID=A0A931I3R1_9HYPH|nr:LLM class flavin-dependent oxidoreductase [Methylobrevis albus]MBH0238919.1 LLM class flavin-dependent oxidoreductase [Methylobrevis albus]